MGGGSSVPARVSAASSHSESCVPLQAGTGDVIAAEKRRGDELEKRASAPPHGESCVPLQVDVGDVLRNLENELAAERRRADEAEKRASKAEKRAFDAEKRAVHEQERANKAEAALEEHMQLEEALVLRIRDLEIMSVAAAHTEGTVQDSDPPLETRGEEARSGDNEQWEWFGKLSGSAAPSSWHPYDKDVSAALNDTLAAGRTNVTLEIPTGIGKRTKNTYEMDLHAMTQTNAKTRMKREIRRAPARPSTQSDPEKQAATFLSSIGTILLQKDAPSLVKGLQDNTWHRGVQIDGCKALVAMAAISESMRLKLAKLGAVEVILDAMAAHRDDSSLQETACRALRRMTWSPKVMSDNVRTSIVAILGMLSRVLPQMPCISCLHFP